MIKGLLYIAIFFPILYGCNKICTPRDYEFNGGIANVYPDKDSIQIGDTLWFSCYIPVNLKYFVANASDSENYNISSATNFNTDFHLTSPTGVNMKVGAMDSFSFVSKIGKVQMNPLAPDASQTISFATNDSAYLASFGIIARTESWPPAILKTSAGVGNFLPVMCAGSEFSRKNMTRSARPGIQRAGRSALRS